MYQKLVEFSNQPPLFNIRVRPDGMAIITLHDHITRDATADEQRWSADVYTLIMPYVRGLDTRVANNYAAWLAKARDKAAEEAVHEATQISDKDRFAILESAVMELAELATGGGV